MYCNHEVRKGCDLGPASLHVVACMFYVFVVLDILLRHCSYRAQKSLFMSTVFLLLMFSKKKGIDHSSPEFGAIEVGMEIIEQTGKRYCSSNEKFPISDVPS